MVEELTEKDFIDGTYNFTGKNANIESSLDEHYIRLDVKENSELTWKQVLDSYEELRKYNANAKEDKKAVMMVNLKHASVEKKAEIIKLKQVDHIMNEIRILTMIDHPFLVRLLIVIYFIG